MIKYSELAKKHLNVTMKYCQEHVTTTPVVPIHSSHFLNRKDKEKYPRIDGQCGARTSQSACLS